MNNPNSKISSPQALPGQIGEAVPKNPYGETTRSPPQMSPYYNPPPQQGQQMVYQVAAGYGYPDPNYPYYGMPYYGAPNQFAYADGSAYGQHPQQVAHQHRMRQAQGMPPQAQVQPPVSPQVQQAQQAQQAQAQKQVQKQVAQQIAQQAAQQQQQKLRSPSVKEEDMKYKFVAPAIEATGKTLFQFPFYVNSGEEEFYVAKIKRNKLRDVELKDSPKEVPAEVEERILNSQKGVAQTISTVEAEKLKKIEPTSIEKSSEVAIEKPVEKKIETVEAPVQKVEEVKTKEIVQEKKEQPTVAAEKEVEEEEFVEKDASPKKAKQAKPESVDWSALALKNSAAAAAKKDKKPSASNATFIPITSSSTAVNGQNGIPKKKQTAYNPSTEDNKSKQSLGVVSLRSMLIDDYIPYVLKSNVDLMKKSIHARGITNINSTCFMSSVLQVLLFCDPFTKLLNVLQVESINLEEEFCPMLKALIKFFDNFHEKKDSAISPKEFFEKIKTLSKFRDYRLGQQEDAEEFLTQLLDQLHEELVGRIKTLTASQITDLLTSAANDEYLKHIYLVNLDKYKTAEFLKSSDGALRKQIDEHLNMVGSEDEWHVAGKNTNTKNTVSKRTTEVEPSPVSMIFGGQTKSVLKNPNNKKEPVSITFDPVQTIQLDISSKEVTTLSEAFEKLNEEETIVFDRSTANSSKQTFLYKLPQVLMVQLKRFEFVSNDDSKPAEMTNYNARHGHAKKINKKVEYELEFEIPKSVISDDAEEQNNEYSLTGVIYHHGSTPSSGHYTCDVLNKSNGKWYSIDDDKVRESSKAEVLKCGGDTSKTAYILLYSRNN